MLPLLLFLLWALPAAAQTTTSTIEGTVTDASGAAVPGASVKVSGTTLASERTATTGATGVYRVTALPAGDYTVALIVCMVLKLVGGTFVLVRKS